MTRRDGKVIDAGIRRRGDTAKRAREIRSRKTRSQKPEFGRLRAAAVAPTCRSYGAPGGQRAA
jgi:hypothetical protein